jgi:preprotein translocase subunit SecB
MKKAAIVIEDYFIKAMRFSLRPGFEHRKPLEDGVVPPAFEVKTEFVQPKDDLHQCQCVLDIELPDDPNDKFPYTFALRVAGTFRVDDSVSAEAAEQIFKVNGTSVLFSMSRELLITLTGRGGYPPFLLPTVSFTDLLETKARRGTLGATKKKGTAKAKNLRKAITGTAK